MVESLAVLLLIVPAGLGLVLGSRRGAARVGWTLLGTLAPPGAGVSVAAAALQAGWYAPAGLFTPLLLGVAAAHLSAWGLRPLRRRAAVPVGCPGVASRIVGGLAGCAVGGLVSAGIMLSAAAADALTADPQAAVRGRTGVEPEETGSGLRLVRFVPVLGSLVQELDALAYVLGTSPEVRERFVEQNGWDRLRDTPSFLAIRADKTLRRDIASAAEGDIGALFRLQRSPKVLRFFQEREVQEVVRGLRPTDLARRLRAAEASLARPSS